MQLLIVRHAIAEDPEVFAHTGRDDSERPLTDAGRDKMRRAAAGLVTLVPSIDVLGSSPYTRAMQTAQIVAEAYGIRAIETLDALVPEAPFARFLTWIEPPRASGVVAAVGHEPHLSGLVTWLVSGLAESRVAMKKGGACLIEFEGQAGAGAGVLQWLVTPGQLRELGAR
jgi:phosphohistidine phosphatase